MISYEYPTNHSTWAKHGQLCEPIQSSPLVFNNIVPWSKGTFTEFTFPKFCYNFINIMWFADLQLTTHTITLISIPINSLGAPSVIWNCSRKYCNTIFIIIKETHSTKPSSTYIAKYTSTPLISPTKTHFLPPKLLKLNFFKNSMKFLFQQRVAYCFSPLRLRSSFKTCVDFFLLM